MALAPTRKKSDFLTTFLGLTLIALAAAVFVQFIGPHKGWMERVLAKYSPHSPDTDPTPPHAPSPDRPGDTDRGQKRAMTAEYDPNSDVAIVGYPYEKSAQELRYEALYTKALQGLPRPVLGKIYRIKLKGGETVVGRLTTSSAGRITLETEFGTIVYPVHVVSEFQHRILFPRREAKRIALIQLRDAALDPRANSKNPSFSDRVETARSRLKTGRQTDTTVTAESPGATANTGQDSVEPHPEVASAIVERAENPQPIKPENETWADRVNGSATENTHGEVSRPSIKQKPKSASIDKPAAPPTLRDSANAANIALSAGDDDAVKRPTYSGPLRYNTAPAPTPGRLKKVTAMFGQWLQYQHRRVGGKIASRVYAKQHKNGVAIYVVMHENYRSQNYDLRFQVAEGMWRFWSFRSHEGGLISDVDSAHIVLLSSNNLIIGGSSKNAGSKIWVKR